MYSRKNKTKWPRLNSGTFIRGSVRIVRTHCTEQLLPLRRKEDGPRSQRVRTGTYDDSRLTTTGTHSTMPSSIDHHLISTKQRESLFSLVTTQTQSVLKSERVGESQRVGESERERES
jgi:hypothetical protein